MSERVRSCERASTQRSRKLALEWHAEWPKAQNKVGMGRGRRERTKPRSTLSPFPLFTRRPLSTINEVYSIRVYLHPILFDPGTLLMLMETVLVYSFWHIDSGLMQD